MKKSILIIEGILLTILISSFFFLGQEFSNFRNLAIIIIVILMLIPPFLDYNLSLKKQRQKEEKFLEFVRDIVENVRSGTPISKSIINIRNRDYGSLSPHVLKLANQIYLGIPLSQAFDIFAKETKSQVISRSINLISEANRSGGQIDTILNSVSNSVNQTENLKKERRAAIFNLVVQGYIIFFVFILITLVLEFFLMPLIGDVGVAKDLNIEIQAKSDDNLSSTIFFLLVVQSFFSGLVIGKISEGKISSGIKHSFILTSLAVLMYSLARAIFG